MGGKLEIYKDKPLEFRWRLIHTNRSRVMVSFKIHGEKEAQCGIEGFPRGEYRIEGS
jgi:uncharacterized protein YegP (UPF0339 family)